MCGTRLGGSPIRVSTPSRTKFRPSGWSNYRVTFNSLARSEISIQERSLDFATVTKAFLAADLPVAERDGRRLVVGLIDGDALGAKRGVDHGDRAAAVTMRPASKAETRLL